MVIFLYFCSVLWSGGYREACNRHSWKQVFKLFSVFSLRVGTAAGKGQLRCRTDYQSYEVADSAGSLIALGTLAGIVMCAYAGGARVPVHGCFARSSCILSLC